MTHKLHYYDGSFNKGLNVRGLLRTTEHLALS